MKNVEFRYDTDQKPVAVSFNTERDFSSFGHIVKAELLSEENGKMQVLFNCSRGRKGIADKVTEFTPEDIMAQYDAGLYHKTDRTVNGLHKLINLEIEAQKRAGTIL